ncbi:MAG: hypothetical protein Q9213_007548 [Squamulea squamosa]
MTLRRPSIKIYRPPPARKKMASAYIPSTNGFATVAIPGNPNIPTPATANNPNPKRFLHLPLEIHKNAFTYLSHNDLLTTLRVSSQFFALACAQLYRDLDFKLTNSDIHDGDSSSIRTAEALQTIIAGEHNYGQYIKSFRLTMVDDNSQTSAVMSRFLWDKAGFASKSLNVSLLLLVKKATMLESFFWDVPIELSGAVYQALQKIQGLRNLRLRLDVSLSLKLTIHPGPLPGSSGISNHPPSTSMSSFPPLPPFGSSSQFGSLPGAKPRAVKKKKLLLRNFWTGNRELSGFKHLSNLSLLGISSLDYLEEISACMKSNTTTLKSLSLSLSYEMALRARKTSAAPPPAEDSASDEEDEELIDPGPATNPVPLVPASTEADVRKEKQAQETILARIFDMEQQQQESKRLERNLVQSSDKLGLQSTFHNVIQDVKAMAKKLSEFGSTDSSGELITREAIEMVHKATAEYLNIHPSEVKKVTSGNNGSIGDLSAGQSHPPIGSSALPEDSSLVSNELPPGPSFSTQQAASIATQIVQNHGASNGFGIFNENPLDQPLGSSATGVSEPYPPSWPPLGSAPTWDGQNTAPAPIVSNHELPNLFPPLPSEVAETQEPTSSIGNTGLVVEQAGGETAPLTVDPVPLTATLLSHEPMDESLDIDMTHPDPDPSEVVADQEIISDEEDESNGSAGVDLPSPRKRGRFEVSTEAVDADQPNSSNSQENGAASPVDANLKKEQSPEEAMQMWIRERHGYQLEEIKLYWIPMRAGILSRALDLAVLKRISLLNCGSQDGFWMILAGFQSRQGTIGLKTIHTDNVSKSFLKFLKTFGGLTELFMHERTKKSDTDSMSSQAKVSITEIRQLALRKHLKTLERLMIKNEMDSSWDLDSITIMLLSNKGSNLVELAISLGAKQFHHMMQNLSALKNLQALHLLAVRGANSGGLSHLEYLNSIVDNLSHQPLSMRIKYLSVDNILSHIHRRPITMSRRFKQAKLKRQQEKSSAQKGKGKAKATDTSPDFASDASSETDFREDKELHDMYALKVKASMLNDPKEVEHIKIFRHEFRAGAF